MLKAKEDKNNLVLNSFVDLGEDVSAEAKGKGRKFVSRFIEAGLAHYEQFGDVLITKETLDTFIQTMVGCPVIIRHKDITDKNADKERVGVISRVWYNENDGWFYCEGVIWDKQAIDLIKNKDWNVSCTYDFVSDNTGGMYHGKRYDREFTGGEFLHLALVDNPRYERANIVMNSKEQVENDHWITVGADKEENKKGTHVLVEDGETNKEATERKVAEWNKEKENKPKEHTIAWHNERTKSRKEKLEKLSKGIKDSPDYNAEYAREAVSKLAQSERFSGYRYDIDFDELIKDGHGDALDYIGQIYAKETGARKKRQQEGFEYLRTNILDDLSETEKGFLDKPKKEKDKATNSIENKGVTTMTVLNELEDFIKGVIANACDKKEEVKEEIDEKEAENADEEEKEEKFEEEKEIATNKCKAKNEKEEKEEEKEEEKAENEEEEKEEAKEEKKEEKEEDKEKAENSMETVRQIANGGAIEPEPTYISRAERLKLGEKY